MSNNIEEQLVHKILQKSTAMKASPLLAQRILNQWQTEEEQLLTSSPIIPRIFWLLLVLLLVGVLFWGISNMPISPSSSELANVVKQASVQLAQAISGIERIVFPTMMVLAIMILINSVLLKSQFFYRQSSV